jgi:predicted PurR-regulated permease PerM
MKLDYILWMYILIFIVILLVLLRNDKELIHSIFLALVISLIFLFITKPPNDVSLEVDNISCVFIYFTIVFISFCSILLYSGIMAYKNLNKNQGRYLRSYKQHI